MKKRIILDKLFLNALSLVRLLSADPAGSICSPPYLKKCLVISLVHRVLISFRQWPLVSFMFSSILKMLYKSSVL